MIIAQFTRPFDDGKELVLYSTLDKISDVVNSLTDLQFDCTDIQFIKVLD